MKQRLLFVAACLSLVAVSLAVYTPVVAAQDQTQTDSQPQPEPQPNPGPTPPEDSGESSDSGSGGFFSRAWNLVKKGAGAVADGAQTGAGAVASGVQTGAGAAADAVQGMFRSYGRSQEIRSRAQYEFGAEVGRLAVETETGRNITAGLVGLGVALIPGGGAASRGAGTAVRSGLAARAQQAVPGAIAGVGTGIGLSHVPPRSGGTVANRGTDSSSSSSSRGSSGSPAIGSPRTSSGSSASSSQSNSGGQSSIGSTK